MEAAQQPEQTRPLRRRRVALFALIVFGAVVALAAAAFFSLKPRYTFPENLADFAPANSLAYVSLDARPILTRQKEFEPVVKAWKESKAFAQIREELGKELRGKGLDLQKDIAPWVGPVLALAITDLPDMGPAMMGAIPFGPSPFTRGPKMQPPGFLAILTARNPGKAQTALSEATEKSGAKATKESYKGVELIHLRGGKAPGELIYAVAENLVFISNRAENVKAGLDNRAAKSGRLSDEQAYQKVMLRPSSAPERVLTYYLNFQVLQKALLGKSPFAFPGGAMSLQSMKYLDAVGGGVVISPDRLEMESLSWGRNQAEDPTRKVLSALPPVGRRAFQFLPKDSVAALAMQSPAAYWRLFKQYFMSAPVGLPFNPIAEVGKGLKKETGLDLEQDILGWMSGEMALGVFDVNFRGMQGRPGVLPIQAVMVIEDRDAATLKTKLARLRSAVQAVIAKRMGYTGPVWAEQKSGAAVYNTLMLPGFPLSITLGQAGRIAFLTTSPGALKKCLAAGVGSKDSITSNPIFQQTRKILPRRPIVLLFAEPSRLAAGLPQTASENPLASIKTIALGEEFLPQGARSVMRVEMDYAGFLRAFDTAFSDARAQARKATCISNEKQIALAMIMFAGEHDGRLPDASRWTEEIMPYAKNERILHCPEDTSKAGSSYGMNAALSGKKLDEIPNPSETVLLFETAHPGPSPSGGPGSVVAPRHPGGNNFAYADGHVKLEKEPPAF